MITDQCIVVVYKNYKTRTRAYAAVALKESRHQYLPSSSRLLDA